MYLTRVLLAALVITTGLLAADSRPAYVDHRQWHTPVKFQTGSNCWIFAEVAALEARLNRMGYGALDLSERFADHMGCVFFLESCQFDGRYRTTRMRIPDAHERETGCYVHNPHNTVESATPCQRLSIPEQRFLNILEPGEADPENPLWKQQYHVSSYNLDLRRLPRAALTAPLYYGISAVEWLPRPDAARPEALEAVLAAGHDIIWGFLMGGDIDSHPWKYGGPADTNVAGHGMVLVGYDRRDPKNPYFIAKNSWGPVSEPGTDGFTYISYDFIKYGANAHFISAIKDPAPWPELKAVGRWNLKFGGEEGVLDLYHLPGMMTHEFRHNDYRDEAGRPVEDRRLGTFYRRGDPQQPYRVNGSVSRDSLVLYIDFDNPAPRWDILGGWKVELAANGPEGNRWTGTARLGAGPSLLAEAALAPGEAEPLAVSEKATAGNSAQDATDVPAFIQEEFRVVWSKVDGGRGSLGEATGPIYQGADGVWRQDFQRGRMSYKQPIGIEIDYD